MYPSKKITMFAVYRTFIILGRPCRSLQVAFPKRDDAQKWIDEHPSADRGKPDQMIEEIDATMHAWDGLMKK